MFVSAAGKLAGYAAARGAEATFTTLPETAGAEVGRALGSLAYRVRARRRTVMAQLAAAFPDRSTVWVERTARACYRHFGREIATLARLRRLDPRELLARTDESDAAARHIERALAKGAGAIVVTGHIGNWELAGAWLAGLGIPVGAVVKRQRDPRFDRHMNQVRASLGVDTIYMEDAPRGVVRILAQGGVVALVADQDAGTGGVFVPFMGRPASTHRGPARLARIHGAPLVFGALVRGDGRYRAVVEPVPMSSSSSSDDLADDARTTADWVALLERCVRRDPHQYFWLHRRWKTAMPAGTLGGPGLYEAATRPDREEHSP